MEVKNDLKESVASKKLWFSVFAVMIGFVFGVLVGIFKWDNSYSTFTGLLEFVTATYLTGNIASRAVSAYHAKVTGPKPEDPKAKKP